MQRTNDQNGYYHAVIVPVVAKVKNTDNADAHKYLKSDFFEGRSTTVIDFDEWEEIMKNIREFFSKKENGGVWIPEPNGDPLPPNCNE